jgi:gluconokinase
VNSGRITGGAFRSALWREVMAATLDKPMQAVGDAEGSALGAAALGLHAVGLSPRLEDAPAMLGVTFSQDDLRVEPDPSLVSVYAHARTAVPRLADALEAVAGLFGTADRMPGKSGPVPARG